MLQQPVFAHSTAVPVMRIGDWHGTVPMKPLLVPVTTQRVTTLSPLAFWKISTTSKRRWSMLARKAATHLLELRTRTDLDAARGNGEIVGDQRVDGVGVPGLPDLAPEVLGNRYGISVAHHIALLIKNR